MPIISIMMKLSFFNIADINKVSNKTASLELGDLVRKNLLKVDGKGRSTRYIPKT